MSTLSISPFSSSPLHSFRLPKSSSGRSNCGSDVDWSAAFTSSNSFNMHDEQQQQQHQQQQLSNHNHNSHFSSHQQLDGLPRSTSFPHLATSPNLFSPLDAQSSSPTLISPKLFSPLDSLSPPRLFASSRLLDVASPSHLSPSPLFTGGLSVSPHHASHHSSLTASLSARRHPDPFSSTESTSSSQSCPTDSFVPSTATASVASSSSSSSSTGHVKEEEDVTMTPAGAPSATSPLRPASSNQPRPASSSAFSDMSNDHYLSFEVLNIDSLTGHIKTEETAFSPANAAVFDFVSLQQPLQDALTANNGSGAQSSSSSAAPSSASQSASSPQPDYAYPALSFDDADAELLSRASSPASQLETEDALDRITSPPDSSFFSSHAHNHTHNHNHNHNHSHAYDGQHSQPMPSPFTLPPTSARQTRSYSSRASRRSLSSHSQSQSTPSTPQYSSTASHPSLQLQTDLTLLQSSVSHMDYQQRVKFVESFKALADKGESVTGCVDGESSGMDPAVLNMIFSPADATLDELEQDEEDEAAESDVDGDERMDEDGQEDVQYKSEYTGERLTGRRRKRLQVPLSPCRRFSVPALRTNHPGSHVSGHPFPPLSPSLSVSSHNSSGSSPIPRSLASGSDEDSLHANSPHPRMAASVMPVSVMAQQITPVQAMRVGVSASNGSSGSNVTTATAVVEEVMNALPVAPSAVVTAEAVTAASPVTSPTPTPTNATAAAMAVAVQATAVKAKSSKVAVSTAVVLDGVVPAAVVPASPVHSSTAVTATLASAASPSTPTSIHRARVLPSVPPRQAYALPNCKKLKTGKALPASMYSSAVTACISAAAVPATVAYAQPLHAAPVHAQAVEAKSWKALKCEQSAL